MKVGVYIGGIRPQGGGAFTFESSIVEALIANRNKHELVFFFYGHVPERWPDLGVKYVQLKYPPAQKSASGRFKIFRKIIDRLTRNQKDIDLLKSKIADLSYMSDCNNNLNAALLENKIEIVWFLNQGFIPVQVPAVTTVWDFGHKEIPIFPEISFSGSTFEARQSHLQAIVGRSCAIFVGTDTARIDIERFFGVPKEKVYVNPFPVPKDLENIDLTSPLIRPDRLPIELETKDFIFYPAQFWPHKNHVLLFEALKILKDQYQIEMTLVLTGADKGNLTYLKDKVRQMSLEKQVYFLGFVEREDVIYLYRQCRAMVFPSLLGPDNFPPIEAMALGCPVVAANVRGASSQLGDAACIFNGTSEVDFVEKLLPILKNSEQRQMWIEKGFQQVANLKAENYAAKAISVIDSMEAYRRNWSPTEVFVHL